MEVMFIFHSEFYFLHFPLAVSGSRHEEGPSCSPDGKRIAFSSSRSGDGNIWVMDVDIDKIRERLKSED